MPASESFTAELRDVWKDLAKAQHRLASLKGLADMEGLPNEVARTLQRKHKVLGYAREDLAEIPKIVAREEARR